MQNGIIAIQLDPISKLTPKTDSSLLIANELYKRGYMLFIYTPSNLFYQNNEVYARGNFIKISSYSPFRYSESKTEAINLATAKAILIRQNPPFDMKYITATYLLELIKEKTFIINNPSEIRNYPEKLSVLYFPEFIPPTLIASSNINEVMAFIETHREIVIKPIYAFGGIDIRKLSLSTPDLKAIIKLYIRKYGNFILQQYLPNIRQGDKRVILIDGEILDSFKRVPNSNDFRANLVVGGTAEATDLSKEELKICEKLKPELKKRGLFFTGIDIIDKYLIEINVTSPTGLITLNRLYSKKVEEDIVNQIESKLYSSYKGRQY